MNLCEARLAGQLKTFSHSGHRYSTCTIIEHLGRRTFLSTENVFILKHILIPKKHLLKLGTIVIVIVVIVIVVVCYCYYCQLLVITIIVNCLLLLLLSIVCYCYYCQLFVIVIIVKCFLLLSYVQPVLCQSKGVSVDFLAQPADVVSDLGFIRSPFVFIRL